MNQHHIKSLIVLLGSLRALKWHYWNCHWMSKGENSYGDHLLFERLYSEKIDEQIDVLAEKIIALSKDPYVLDSDIMLIGFNRFVEKYKQTDFVLRSLDMEKQMQTLIENVYTNLKKNNVLSLGMDDYLMATANERETVVYLLTQRSR